MDWALEKALIGIGGWPASPFTVPPRQLKSGIYYQDKSLRLASMKGFISLSMGSMGSVVLQTPEGHPPRSRSWLDGMVNLNGRTEGIPSRSVKAAP
jgi:hypothetical protein